MFCFDFKRGLNKTLKSAKLRVQLKRFHRHFYFLSPPQVGLGACVNGQAPFDHFTRTSFDFLEEQEVFELLQAVQVLKEQLIGRSFSASCRSRTVGFWFIYCSMGSNRRFISSHISFPLEWFVFYAFLYINFCLFFIFIYRFSVA